MINEDLRYNYKNKTGYIQEMQEKGMFLSD